MIDTSTAQRLRRFRRSWNPRFLWPDMTGERFASAMAELARVTAALVDRPESRASIHDTAGDTRAISIAAFTAGIGPLLGYWMETGQLTASDATAEALAAHLDHGSRRAERLQSELEVLLRRFDNEGVPVTLLKGMHTAWVYFPEPGTRPVADIDLLIKRDALPAINRVLGGLGFTRGGRVRERETWRAPGPQVPLSLELTHCDNPWEVDLHLTLDRRMVGEVTASLGPVRPSDLRQWQVGPVDVHVLAQPLLAAYLAVHVSNHFETASLLRLEVCDPVTALCPEREPATARPAILDLEGAGFDFHIRLDPKAHVRCDGRLGGKWREEIGDRTEGAIHCRHNIGAVRCKVHPQAQDREMTAEGEAPGNTQRISGEREPHGFHDWFGSSTRIERSMVATSTCD